MAPRLAVLGWDSATFDVIDPMVAARRLPAFEALQSRGFRAALRSTWPPMTDCAWTSAFTGRNPGGHGIFGSWYRAPGKYACRYFSSRDRRAPALWELASSVRWLVWNVPMAFPPQEVNGVMVSGYGAPPGATFCAPASWQEKLAARYPLEDIFDCAPHSSLERFLEDLVRGLDVQAEALMWAAQDTAAECVVAVWPHVDRAQHFFWQFRGTSHPLAGAVLDVYQAMDRATGKLLEAWPDADFLVVSDHGAGTLHGDVNVGAWLGQGGYASHGARRTSRLVDLAWAMPPPVRRFGRRLAPGMARRAFSATLTGQLGSFEWDRTRAFLGWHSDLWLNLAGREEAGIVTQGEAEALLDELAGGLLAIRDPATGTPVFGGAHRRAELFSGPAAAMGPDLMLDSWSAGYRVAPGRERSEQVVIPPAPLAGVKAAWSADHRPLGVFAGAGPRLARGRTDELSLYDLCPLALALLEQPVPDGLDGSAREEVLSGDFLAAHPLRGGATAAERNAGGDYSNDEAEAVTAHLKDLGYIE